LEPSENAGRYIQIDQKARRMLTHYAARWRQTCELFQNWQIWAPLPHASNVAGPPNFQIPYTVEGPSSKPSSVSFAL